MLKPTKDRNVDADESARGNDSSEQYGAEKLGNQILGSPDHDSLRRADVWIGDIHQAADTVDEYLQKDDANTGNDCRAQNDMLVASHEVATGLPGADRINECPCDIDDYGPDNIVDGLRPTCTFANDAGPRCDAIFAFYLRQIFDGLADAAEAVDDKKKQKRQLPS